MSHSPWAGFRVLAIGATAALATLAAAGPAEAARKLASYGSVTAYVPDDMSCSDTVAVWMIASDKAAFEGDRRAVQRLVGGIRAVLGIECPDASVKTLQIVGQVNRKMVWKGVAAATTSWAVVSLEPEPAPAPPTLAKSPPEPSKPVQLSNKSTERPPRKTVVQDAPSPRPAFDRGPEQTMTPARSQDMLTSAAVDAARHGMRHDWTSGPSVFP